MALDTNVLVRLQVNDDPAQAEQAAALIDAIRHLHLEQEELVRRALAWHRLRHGRCRCAPLGSQRWLRSVDPF